jgi:hypothetical protein
MGKGKYLMSVLQSKTMKFHGITSQDIILLSGVWFVLNMKIVGIA